MIKSFILKKDLKYTNKKYIFAQFITNCAKKIWNKVL